MSADPRGCSTAGRLPDAAQLFVEISVDHVNHRHPADQGRAKHRRLPEAKLGERNLQQVKLTAYS